MEAEEQVFVIHKRLVLKNIYINSCMYKIPVYVQLNKLVMAVAIFIHEFN